MVFIVIKEFGKSSLFRKTTFLLDGTASSKGAKKTKLLKVLMFLYIYSNFQGYLGTSLDKIKNVKNKS